MQLLLDRNMADNARHQREGHDVYPKVYPWTYGLSKPEERAIDPSEKKKRDPQQN